MRVNSSRHSDATKMLHRMFSCFLAVPIGGSLSADDVRARVRAGMGGAREQVPVISR